MPNQSKSEFLNKVKAAMPDEARRKKGKYAFIECFQKIPCNPCSTSCPFGAILPMEDINDLPRIDYEACTGCGICAQVCPGLAIFIIDESRTDGRVAIAMPYEYLPLPQKGEVVKLLDREGQALAKGEVVSVMMKKEQKTSLVSVAFDPAYLLEARAFAFLTEEEKGQTDQSFVLDIPLPDDTIVCRCEGVTLGEIRALIAQGYNSIDEIKRLSRAGMGPCQGRTCRPLIMQEIARATGTKYSDMAQPQFRPPIKPLPLAFFAGGESDE